MHLISPVQIIGESLVVKVDIAYNVSWYHNSGNGYAELGCCLADGGIKMK